MRARAGITQIFPPSVERLKELAAAMKDAALELALEQISARSAAASAACFRCGVQARESDVIRHPSSCAVGKILAYIEAVNDRRMSDLPDEPSSTPQLTSEDHRFIEPYRVEYEVEEHPWAGEEGNCPSLGRSKAGAE